MNVGMQLAYGQAVGSAWSCTWHWWQSNAAAGLFSASRVWQWMLSRHRHGAMPLGHVPSAPGMERFIAPVPIFMSSTARLRRPCRPPRWRRTMHQTTFFIQSRLTHKLNRGPRASLAQPDRGSTRWGRHQEPGHGDLGDSHEADRFLDGVVGPSPALGRRGVPRESVARRPWDAAPRAAGHRGRVHR